MTRQRTSLGDYVTTKFSTEPTGEANEHVTIECTQPLRIISLEPPGKDIYARPVDAWSGMFEVKKNRTRRLTV